jgi:hypothetical protein
VLHTGGKGNAYSILDGKLKGKRLFRKTRSTWEDNINMNLKKYQESGWTGLLRIRTGTSGRL